MRAEITLDKKRRGAVLRVMCLSLMMVVAAVASLNVALPGLRARHGRHADPAAMDRRRVRARVRGAAAPGRRDRRPLRAQADPRPRARALRARVARRHVRADAGTADRAARRDGRRSRVRDARDPVGDHHDLPAGGARQGGRDVGRRRGGRRGDRPARLGRAARVALVAGGLRPQRHPRRGRARRHDRDRARDPRVAPAAPRPDRHPAFRARAQRARLRDHRGRRAGLERRRRGRVAGGRRRRARALRALGAAPPRADARPAQLPAPRLRRRVAVGLGAVLRDVRLPLPDADLPPARARPLAPAGVGGAAADGARRDPALARRAGDRRPRRACASPAQPGSR